MAAEVKRSVSHTFGRIVPLYTLLDKLGTKVDTRRNIPANTEVTITLAKQDFELAGVKGIYYSVTAVIAGQSCEGFLHEDDIPCRLFEMR